MRERALGARRPVLALHEDHEAAARHVADEIHAGLAHVLEQARDRVDQRVALFEADAVIQASQLVDLGEPRRESHGGREQALEVFVDRHLARKERERVGVAPRQHARTLQGAHHVGAGAHAEVAALGDDHEAVGEPARVRLHQQRGERSKVELRLHADRGQVGDLDAGARGEARAIGARRDELELGARGHARDRLARGDRNRGERGRRGEAFEHRGDRVGRRRGLHRAQEIVGGGLGAGAQPRRGHDRNARIGERSLGFAREPRVRPLGRAPDEPALAAGDADVLGHAEIFRALDPLRDHLGGAARGDVLDRAQELQLHRVLCDAGYEMLVGLHEFGFELGPQPQAREALAQVVDRHAKSHRAVQHQRLVHEAEVDGGIVFRQFDHHARGLEPEAAQETPGALLLEAALDDQLRRDVEEEAAVEPRAGERPQDLLHADDVELEGEPGFVRRGEKLVRRVQHRALGAAHQRLVADDAAFAEREDRLENAAEGALLEDAAQLLEGLLANLGDVLLHATPCWRNHSSMRFQPSSAASLRYEGR